MTLTTLDLALALCALHLPGLLGQDELCLVDGITGHFGLEDELCLVDGSTGHFGLEDELCLVDGIAASCGATLALSSVATLARSNVATEATLGKSSWGVSGQSIPKSQT